MFHPVELKYNVEKYKMLKLVVNDSPIGDNTLWDGNAAWWENEREISQCYVPDQKLALLSFSVIYSSMMCRGMHNFLQYL